MTARIRISAAALSLAVTVLVPRSASAAPLLVNGAATGAVQDGASWATALAIAAVLNLVGAAALGWWMLALIKELPFTALLRQLRGRAPEKPQ